MSGSNQKPGKKHGEALKPWVEMQKPRLECHLELKKFLKITTAVTVSPRSGCIRKNETDYLDDMRLIKERGGLTLGLTVTKTKTYES